MLTFTTLASGSSGNAALVSCGNTHVLLDAGISAKRITAGLKSLGIAPEALAAVLITHEHHDHISGLQVLTKRFRLPVVASGPTGRQLCYRVPFMDDLIRQQEPGTGIQLGDLWIESFPTPHDAAGSVGYSITGGGHRVVLCTDLGYVTDQVKQAVRGCDLLVCEANHDEDWVRSGPYPYHLKARILGDEGHLSNDAAAEFAARMARCGTRCIVLAHLSRENNTPQRAWDTVQRRLNTVEAEVLLEVAPRSEVSPPYGTEVLVCSE